ncbi:MAG TPA: helix-turn-helix transcriptional regulator [Gaiellaceae bacterium]|nr:helix-turn-helix transcriptional regulator [Gaiellaceae bacterium]
MRADVSRGHLDLLLLGAVAKEPLHGYAIVEAIRDASEGAFELGEGTVYPALYRLEAAGLLASDASTVNGRRRRTYRLTAKGRRELASQRREWEGFVRAVNAVTA